MDIPEGKVVAAMRHRDEIVAMAGDLLHCEIKREGHLSWNGYDVPDPFVTVTIEMRVPTVMFQDFYRSYADQDIIPILPESNLKLLP